MEGLRFQTVQFSSQLESLVSGIYKRMKVDWLLEMMTNDIVELFPHIGRPRKKRHKNQDRVAGFIHTPSTVYVN